MSRDSEAMTAREEGLVSEVRRLQAELNRRKMLRGRFALGGGVMAEIWTEGGDLTAARVRKLRQYLDLLAEVYQSADADPKETPTR